jgi:hypothetical protein
MTALKKDPTLKAFEDFLKKGYSWGDYAFMENQKMTSAERAEKKKKGEEEVTAMRKNANLKKKKSLYVNSRGTLKRIAKKCKWECAGEKCWAHEKKACPFIHKGENGYNNAKKGGSKTRKIKY